MGLLEKYGIPTPGGRVATNVEQAYKVAESLSKIFRFLQLDLQSINIMARNR